MGGAQSTSVPEPEYIAGKTANQIINDYSTYITDPLKQTFANKRFIGTRRKKNQTTNPNRSFRSLLALLLLSFIVFLLTVALYKWV